MGRERLVGPSKLATEKVMSQFACQPSAWTDILPYVQGSCEPAGFATRV